MVEEQVQPERVLLALRPAEADAVVGKICRKLVPGRPGGIAEPPFCQAYVNRRAGRWLVEFTSYKWTRTHSVAPASESALLVGSARMIRSFSPASRGLSTLR